MTDRWIDLEGCDNARDLGGLPLAGGGLTRPGVLVRTETVQNLTDADVELLVGTLGLRTVIDLRTPKEAAAEGRGPLAMAPVAYHNIPYVPDVYLVPGEPDHDVIVRERAGQQQVEHYLDYLTRPGSQVADSLRVLAASGGTPALFHCAAGKDRTGVLAALVLDIAGVERDAIVDDYVLTNSRLPLIMARLAGLSTYAATDSAPPRGSTWCRPETMWAFLTRLDDRWGGSAGWATANGLTIDELDALRATVIG